METSFRPIAILVELANLLSPNSYSCGISHINGNDLRPIHRGEACPN